MAILEKFQFAALAKCFRHAKYANFSNLMSLARREYSFRCILCLITISGYLQQIPVHIPVLARDLFWVQVWLKQTAQIHVYYNYLQEVARNDEFWGVGMF